MRLRQLYVTVAALAALASGQGTSGAAPAESQRDCYGVGDWSDPVPVCIGTGSYFADVCDAIARLAKHYKLPDGFLARLIWQESRFDPAAISWAGAQGIAQFMPGTARIREVADPFRPAEALSGAAAYLRFLDDKFGNLGLAAAAYNGGENRVARWQASGGSLPAETQAYVQIVTGVPVDSWSAGEVKAADYTLDPQRGFREACVDLAKGLPLPGPVVPSSPWKPWGVLIAQNFSAKVARASFERVRAQYGRILGDEVPLVLTVHNPAFGRAARHSAMLGRDRRKQADALCAELHKAGAACVVVKN